jgi:hypothetical protein
MQANLFSTGGFHMETQEKGYRLCAIALFLIEAGTSLFLSCN